MIAKESLRTLADEKFREIAEDLEKRIDEHLIRFYTMGWGKLHVHSDASVVNKDISNVYCESPVVLKETIEKYQAAGYKIIKSGIGRYDIYVDDDLYEEHMREIEQEDHKRLEKLKAEDPPKKKFLRRG